MLPGACPIRPTGCDHRLQVLVVAAGLGLLISRTGSGMQIRARCKPKPRNDRGTRVDIRFLYTGLCLPWCALPMLPCSHRAHPVGSRSAWGANAVLILPSWSSSSAAMFESAARLGPQPLSWAFVDTDGPLLAADAAVHR